MPARSNPFQAVVFLIEKHLAGDSVVTESHILRDTVTGATREVDITIESAIAGHKVLLGLECRDHKRPQSVGWVEEMHAKHAFLPTVGPILVSSSGFTKEAQAKAASLHIELITPSELTGDIVGGIVDRTVFAKLKQVSVESKTIVVEFEPSPSADTASVQVGPDTTVYTEDGSELCTIAMVGDWVLNHADWTEALEKAVEEVTHFTAGLDNLIRDGSPPIFFEMIDPEPHKVRIASILLTGEAKVVIADFSLKYKEFSGKPYATGQAKFGDLDAVMVATDIENERGEVSVRFT